MVSTDPRRRPELDDEDDGGLEEDEVEVQVAVLTTRIENLTNHLRTHKKDVSTRRGLLGMVNRRARLLRYLKRTDPKRYQALVQRLGIRG